MRIVVVGATGNVGTSVLEALSGDPRAEEIVGLARRPPDAGAPSPARTTWARADVVSDPLGPLFAGADAVVHLAWAIQPSRDLAALRAVNVEGSRRVFEAAAAAGVRTLVYASSVGVYSPGPKDRRVDESWPRDGVRTSFYARHKAEVERILDDVEREAGEGMRVVRLRPGLIFKREAAQEVRRLFVGPLLPPPLVRADLIPIVPEVRRLVVQAVHSRDVAEAYRLATLEERARGAYNVAAEPVLDAAELARLLGARRVPLPAALLRVGAAVTWRLHLQPTPPGWVDMGLGVPLLDTTRIREELGWSPRYSADQALLELLEGMHDGAGADTPALAPRAGGPLRVREFLSGVGRRNP
jgi:nucleoside-diphosphate-sugar epimerase